jgi:hypothetical protein
MFLHTHILVLLTHSSLQDKSITPPVTPSMISKKQLYKPKIDPSRSCPVIWISVKMDSIERTTDWMDALN